MAIDVALAKKGEKEPRLGIIEQIGVSVALARLHAARLAPYGWTPADTDALEAVGTQLKSGLAGQAEGKDGSRSALAAQNTALSQGKELKRKLDRAVRSVFRRKENGTVTAEAFEAGGTIGDSVPKLVGYFVKVEPAVAALAPALQKRLGGLDPVKAVQEARAALEGANVSQERAYQDLPADTLAIYEAKGRALTLLADLIDAGQNAFDGDATESAKFNKDLIVRARKQRPAKSDGPAPQG